MDLGQTRLFQQHYESPIMDFKILQLFVIYCVSIIIGA